MPASNNTPPGPQKLLSAHRAASATPLDLAGQVMDHLVDALAGDPSVPLRRAGVLVDIALHPGTSQTAVAERQRIEKSALNRDIDWLYNYGCVTKNVSDQSARENALTIVGVARTHMLRAASLLRGDMNALQKLLDGYINFFQDYRATLRDAKMVTILSAKGPATRQEMFDHLYNGPNSTDNRALLALIEEGFIESDGTESNHTDALFKALAAAGRKLWATNQPFIRPLPVRAISSNPSSNFASLNKELSSFSPGNHISPILHGHLITKRFFLI
jgi:hypothetical protein